MSGRLSRRSMAEYIAEGLVEGKNKKTLFKQLAAYLVESRRTKELDLIVRDIEWKLAEKGLVQATITSAFDLTSQTTKALEAFLKAETKASEVTLTKQLDPSVLGGVKISIPGREIDQTVAHQLTVLKTRFKKA